MTQPKVIDLTRYTNRDLYDARPPGAGIIAAVVLHHTGGTNSIPYLQHNAQQKSTHKLFAKDGTIYKLVPDHMRAWHAGISSWGGRGDWNDFSLGYEIENKGDGHDPYTPEQYTSVAHSLAYDCALYFIADDWIRRHRDIAPGRKFDTDDSFNLNRLFDLVWDVRHNWPYYNNPVWYWAYRG